MHRHSAGARMSSTKTKTTESAIERVARRWPPPDPVNRMKRDAFRHLLNIDTALNRARPLRTAAARITLVEIDRLWVRPSKLEGLLTSLHAELKAAAEHAAEALYLLSEARFENDLRNLEERSRERTEKKPDE
jgi:hypothetical protein